jgi:CDP-diacylglycerol--serine O-phosphatidyltransferase
MNPLRRSRSRDGSQRRGVRRAVVLMPNGLTLFNLFCGIYAIVLALHGRIAEAPGFIVLGGIADALDGRVARATGTGSRFGEELDSLVDAISFGFAPALIVFLARPAELQGNLDWLLVFIFTACAVMRLARFNVEQAGRAKTHFHGLPSPAAGLTLASFYWFSQTPLYNQTIILFTDSRTLATLPWPNIMRGLMAVLAALMVSDVPYPAFPSVGFNSLKKVLGTLMIAGSVVLLLVKREEFIFPALIAYVAYGILKWMFIGLTGRAGRPDEIYWEREAELHQEDERRSAYDRPHIGKEALEDADLDEEDEAPRRSRSMEARREKRRDERRDEQRDEKRRKRRDESRGEARGEGRGEGRGDKRRDRQRDAKPEGRSESRRERPPRDENKPVIPAVTSAIDTPPSPEAPTIDPSVTGEQPTAERPARSEEDIRARKRRRRRGGRGNRSRRENAEGGNAGGESESSGGESFGGESSGGDSSGGDFSGGDRIPGPSHSDTPNPSGSSE